MAQAAQTPARARRAPQDRRPKQPAKPAVEAGIMDADGWLTVTIAGTPVRVKPFSQWRQSAMDALTDGRLNDWAVRVMGDDDAALWLSLDPTNADVQAFLAEWAEAMGAVAGPADRAALDAFRLRRR